MQFEELLKLIDRLETSSVSYVDYTHAGDHVILSKDGLMTSPTSNVIAQADGSTNIQVRETTSQQTSVGSTNSAETTEVNNEAVAQGETVLSPMVGVAYLQANPEADPFVKVGDTVEKGDVIVLIEAMKLMNEIQAPKSGVITEILVENEAVVEFNQPLVRIK
ncbi:acetyl-CoA carboxylase biotin carboxyl carrier protein [Fundicoccus sp. Sow4_D5]|uniref:acetyl-CoA carboxylase biotin carboxyl carrier protein n=1 Tax=unclassified Fundicoccus TaxID=2761543 RepID=UPI003F93E454